MASRSGGYRFWLLFVGIWTLIVGLFDVLVGFGLWNQLQAEGWPQVTGTIISSDIRISRDDDGTTYHAEIEFSYSVDGTTYTRDRVRFTQFGSSDRSLAEQTISRYPVGSEVDVFYNPRKPGSAVLETGISSSDLFIALFLTPFNVIMIGGWWFLGAAALYRWRRPPAGGVAVRQRGPRTHIRLPRISPLAGALMTALGVSFVSIFIVAFGFGFDPPMWVLVTVWSLTLGLAAVVFFWRSFVIGSGRKDLVIDDEEGFLSLPQSFGRSEDVLVARSAVTCVEVEKVTHRSGKSGTSYTWAPRLTWQSDEGRTHQEKLAEWHDQDRAERFAEWLRGRLLAADGKQSPPARDDEQPPLLDL